MTEIKDKLVTVETLDYVYNLLKEDFETEAVTVEQTESGAVITITDKKGTTTAMVSNGQDGKNGFSPIATVQQTAEGAVITVTDADGTTTATVTNGARGATGMSGRNGADGISATHSWNGTVLTVTSASGTSSADLKGSDGKDGYTPVKGTDFWTPADQAAIVQQVIDTLGGNPVIGVVDSDNNIILTGDLADGVYTFKYEDTEGKVTDIGTLTLSDEPVITYTNLIPLSTVAPNNSAIYNGKGYKENTRWSSSSAAESAATGVYVTGCIPYVNNATVYLKNIRMNKNDTASNVRHICQYAGSAWSSQDISATADFSPVWDAEGNLIQFKLPNWNSTHFRLNTSYIGEDSILTINEPIE